jgi:hypothetical protein
MHKVYDLRYNGAIPPSLPLGGCRGKQRRRGGSPFFMKTLVGRFASPEDASQALFALRGYRPTGTPRPARPNVQGMRITVTTWLCMLGGAALGAAIASGSLATMHLGTPSATPLTPAQMAGGAVLGFALGIPAGLLVGLLLSLLPLRGTSPILARSVNRHHHTIIIQTKDRLIAPLTQFLRDAHAQKVHVLAGKVQSSQITSALDQLSRMRNQA